MRGAQTLCIAEGWATGATIHEATGHPVAVAFFTENLEPVARALRERFPDLRLILCADDDAATPGNPGLTKAKEAACTVGGRLAVPDFGENTPDGATDFNDLVVLRGRDVVAECIGGQVSSKRGVLGVLGVPASPGAGSSRNTRKKPGVPGVPKPTKDSTPEAEDSAPGGRDLPPLSDRPCFQVFNEGIEHPTGKLRPGVWFFGVKHGRKAEDPATLTQQWVCSPLYIDAVTFDEQSNNFGRLLRFKNTIGTWREWAMPMDLLRGLGATRCAASSWPWGSR
jgi:putative DNA primase/helicase